MLTSEDITGQWRVKTTFLPNGYVSLFNGNFSGWSNTNAILVEEQHDTIQEESCLQIKIELPFVWYIV